MAGFPSGWCRGCFDTKSAEIYAYDSLDNETYHTYHASLLRMRAFRGVAAYYYLLSSLSLYMQRLCKVCVTAHKIVSCFLSTQYAIVSPGTRPQPLAPETPSRYTKAQPAKV